MLLTEEMKGKYDVIGFKKNGKVETIHENGTTGMKSSYKNVEEFMTDSQNKKIKGIVLEGING
jgi:CTP-dependent riboflavin kinase